MTEQQAAQPWAAFWRRVGAFAIDSLVIGAVGYMIGAAAFDVFAQMGQWARLVGLLIAVLYFGLLGSRIGGGQTPGKRVLKLRVEGLDGAGLPVDKAIVRAFVLSLPIVLNGFAARSDGGFLGYALLVVGAVLLFGLGLAQIYLLIFNRPSRRMVHDLVAGSAVVRADQHAEAAPLSARHGRIALGLATGVLVLISAMVAYFAQISAGSLAAMKNSLAAVETLPEVMTAGVAENTSVMVTAKTGKTTTHTLVVTARLKAWPKDLEAEAARVARAALTQYRPKPGQGVSVLLQYGFDLGIGSGWRGYRTSYPPPANPAPPMDAGRPS